MRKKPRTVESLEQVSHRVDSKAILHLDKPGARFLAQPPKLIMGGIPAWKLHLSCMSNKGFQRTVGLF